MPDPILTRSPGFSQHLGQRFALWLAGQALPEADSLKPPVRSALFAVAAASAGGIFLALGIGAATAAVYAYLVQQGVAPLTVLLGMALLAVVLGSLFCLFARARIRRSARAADTLRFFPRRGKENLEKSFAALAQGFAEGLLDTEDRR